ncbi:MAG: mechanosensitive ion channel family protein [Flammeovirgaceae bacterium]
MQEFLNLYGKIIFTVFLGILVGFILERIMSFLIKKIEGKVETNKSYKKASNGFFFWSTVLLSIYIASFFFSLSDRERGFYFEFLKIGVIICITVYFIRFGITFIVRNQNNEEGGVIPLASLFLNLFKIISFLIGSLLVLNVLGISITPMLTALGIGGLAVALALQDTLSNLFAGLYIIITKNINIGDYIKFDDNEGHIIDITWRTTTIKTPLENYIIIPNSKLSTSILTNFYLPNKETIITLEIGVSYSSDLHHVERVTIETAKTILNETEGGVRNFEPLVRFRNFAESSINFIVVLKSTDITMASIVRHEFIKKIHERFKKENIEIPFPIRTVYHKQML